MDTKDLLQSLIFILEGNNSTARTGVLGRREFIDALETLKYRIEEQEKKWWKKNQRRNEGILCKGLRYTFCINLGLTKPN